MCSGLKGVDKKQTKKQKPHTHTHTHTHTVPQPGRKKERDDEERSGVEIVGWGLEEREDARDIGEREDGHTHAHTSK